MYDDVIKFAGRSSDLDKTEIFWQKDTYAGRCDAITKNVLKVTGFPPSKNMQPIREGVIKITPQVTLDELKSLAHRINEWYKIDCFQIAVDRHDGTAHLLFDFHLRKTAKSVVINRSQQIALSVMILRSLRLPRPKGTENWLAHFLKERFTDDPEVFSHLLDKIKRARLGKETYALAHDVLTYVQLMCRGVVK